MCYLYKFSCIETFNTIQFPQSLKKVHALHNLEAVGSPQFSQTPTIDSCENSFFNTGFILSKPLKVEYIIVGCSFDSSFMKLPTSARNDSPAYGHPAKCTSSSLATT